MFLVLKTNAGESYFGKLGFRKESLPLSKISSRQEVLLPLEDPAQGTVTVSLVIAQPLGVPAFERAQP